MKINSKVMGLVLICLTQIANGSAQTVGACHTGKLVDLNTRTEIIPGVTSGRYEEKVNKDGKKVINGSTYGGEQTKMIYVLTVSTGDMIYKTENAQNLFFGYNPTDMVVNDAVSICIDKQNLIFVRPNGKQYKTRIVRTERIPVSGIAPNDQQ